MSEPITLTERERAVFAHMARTLGNGTASHDIIVSNALLHFLEVDFQARFAAPAESASPPRVPGASAQALGVGVESGPNQPMDIDKAKRVVNLWRDARGLDAPIPWETTLARFIADALAAERRAGIEAAAQAVAGEREEIDPSNWNDALDAALRAIRALADKPAPDALLVGIEYVREHLRTDGNAVRLIAWLDAEIAARKGG